MPSDTYGDIVEKQYKEQSYVLEAIDIKKNTTIYTNYDSLSAKVLVLAAVSQFEVRITRAIQEYCSQYTDSDERITNLIRSKAIERQFHTYFDWKGRNANKFFGMFGSKFKEECERLIEENDNLKNGVKAFLSLGLDRNKLVHKDLLLESFDKTREEVMETYREARVFVNFVEERFSNNDGS